MPNLTRIDRVALFLIKYFQLTESPKVAIVILNWNGKAWLEKFLPSVVATRYQNINFIVADNGSTDDSISFLQKNYPQVEIIKLPINVGFANGYNQALQKVTADYYVLLNSDVEVQPDWIAPMVQLLESDKTIAACQPKILSYHQKDTFEYAGAAGGWMDCYGYPFAKGRVFDVCEKDKSQYDQQEPIFWATGASLFIRAKLFHEVNGFDGFFFAHQEEIDLCWRLQLAGFKIYSCPSSVVYHVGGGTLPKGNSLKTFLNFRNNRIMLWKNLPFPSKIAISFIRFFLDLLSALKGLVSGDAGYCWAICKAQWAWLTWLLFKQHLSVFPATKTGKLNGVAHLNLIWAYFVKKKQVFSEIMSKNQH
jgi:GT2 family glycosyltransferase